VQAPSQKVTAAAGEFRGAMSPAKVKGAILGPYMRRRLRGTVGNLIGAQVSPVNFREDEGGRGPLRDRGGNA